LGKDLNPQAYDYNLSTNTLEVRNSRNEFLWSTPSRDLAEIGNTELHVQSVFTFVSDLDGDGHNEVVTLVPGTLADGGQARGCVRIFDYGGNLLSSNTLGENVRFGGRRYDQDQHYSFGGSGLVVVRGDGKREIIASAVHFRSPSVVSRISARGENLGEYWHYGHLGEIHAFRSSENGAERVVLAGTNDARDSAGVRFPVVVVLDPQRIAGHCESRGTRGSGFPVSAAEVAYISFPLTEADSAFGTLPFVKYVTVSDGGLLHVVVMSGVPEEAARFALEYVLDENYKVSEVLPMDNSNNTLATLHQKGLIRNLSDAGYRRRFKDAVKYW
jgi:hypothetical protein